jgi:hypothetical protein
MEFQFIDKRAGGRRFAASSGLVLQKLD